MKGDPKGYRYVEHGAFSVTHSGGDVRHVYDSYEGRARLTFAGPSAQALAELAAEDMNRAAEDKGDYYDEQDRWLKIARITCGRDPNDPDLPLWPGTPAEEGPAQEVLAGILDNIVWTTDRTDYPGGVAWTGGLLEQALDWECPSCGPDHGWVKRERAERLPQGIRLFLECGHCGYEGQYDETGSEVN